jgi:type IX secretion system PorP/SprF family membrane protein
MKRILASLIFLSMLMVVKAQQKPQYTQYVQNMQVINPALTGLYSSVYLKSGLRKQWQGIQDAPNTGYVTLSAPVNFERYYLVTEITDFGIEDISTQTESETYFSVESHHGVGITLINDKTGSLGKATANFTYAYHLVLNDKFNLSVGVGLGVGRLSLNATNLKFDDEANYDPALSDLDYVKWMPDVNIGVYLYSADAFVGWSIQNIASQKLMFNEDYKNYQELAHHFITGGYRFWLNEDFSLTPSIMFKYINPAPLSIDYNLKWAYRNKLWIGGAYRKNDAYSGFLGLTISKKIDMGYSYDFTQSELKSISNGSHELVLGIKL